MTQVELSLGAKPWLPSPSSHKVHDLAFYDIPVSGVIRQAGRGPLGRRYFLYWCAWGSTSDFGLWLYAPLKRPEVRKLKSAAGDELMRLQLEIVGDREVTVVLAHHENGIEGRLETRLAGHAKDPAASAGKEMADKLRSEQGAVEQLLAMA